nr:site-specific DNA-methyltransferase [Oscillochloris sp. ZM17-4]
MPLPRLDRSPELRQHLLRYCRIGAGEIWDDPQGRHRVGCLDAADAGQVAALMGGDLAALAIHDPPYNLVAFEQRALDAYVAWCARWVAATRAALRPDSALYIWLGADQTAGFQPLPDVMIMMRGTPFRPRSLITMRNQRGYGTQHNWMAVRQELLYYVLGEPAFHVEAEYTDIPKILRGYYKQVGGQTTENSERGGSANIRAGNVWVDVQQVFYRLEENVSGCYAQKPLLSCERIMRASSAGDDVVLDLFGHSGSTLVAAERLGRRCRTADIDPVYCEIMIRRLERLRASGRAGWQHSNPFEDECAEDEGLRALLGLAGPAADAG